MRVGTSICACIGREESHRNESHITARPVSITLVKRPTPEGNYTPVPYSKPGAPLPARFFPPATSRIVITSTIPCTPLPNFFPTLESFPNYRK